VKREHRRARASAHDVYPDPIRVDPRLGTRRSRCEVTAILRRDQEA
jgi:hypothetical protein